MSTPHSPWPAGCRGALSLTFDDGNLTQLRTAVPLLEQRGMRGTFYMSPAGDNWREALEAWKAARLTDRQPGSTGD